MLTGPGFESRWGCMFFTFIVLQLTDKIRSKLKAHIKLLKMISSFQRSRLIANHSNKSILLQMGATIKYYFVYFLINVLDKIPLYIYPHIDTNKLLFILLKSASCLICLSFLSSVLQLYYFLKKIVCFLQERKK